eukprot:8640883-Alexandrium_andersonii.AAC.1
MLRSVVDRRWRRRVEVVETAAAHQGDVQEFHAQVLQVGVWHYGGHRGSRPVVAGSHGQGEG